MTEMFTQEFFPPIKINEGAGERIIEKREWTKSPTPSSMEKVHVQNMGYIGHCQIEEIWKRYNKNIYVSNYGYVARISEEEAKKSFGEKFEDFEKRAGVAFREMNNNQKALIKDKNEVPENKKNSRCQIYLQVKKGGDVHRMVAELFLQKPIEEGSWCVHHIDNNSYNNSVTNLIWLKGETHQGNHRTFHPMSK